MERAPLAAVSVAALDPILLPDGPVAAGGPGSVREGQARLGFLGAAKPMDLRERERERDATKSSQAW